MSELLSESQVLQKLDLPDFVNLTEDRSKVALFATLINRMEPEVAQKAIDQFPAAFACEALQVMIDCSNAIVRNTPILGGSPARVHDMCVDLIHALKACCYEDNFPLAIQRDYARKMRETAAQAAYFDSRNRRFNYALIGGMAVAVTILVGMDPRFLCGKYQFRLPSGND